MQLKARYREIGSGSLDLPIYHLSMKPISRASGRSAVAAAAYRAGECLTNERDGLTHDFTRREGVEHAEIILPAGVEADWAKHRSALWNAAERAEKRKDARVAREFEIALPHELTAEQRLQATRDFAQALADRYGAAVDFAIHSPHGETDIRNHHAHVMMTVRAVGRDGLGEKTLLERENKWLLAQGQPTPPMQLRELRQSWEEIANERLAAAGLDLTIDHRSHQERGLEIEPTEHMGVHATQMERRGLDVSRARLDAEAARRNAELIRQKPEQVLTLITGEKSVFDRRDVARALHRYIDEPEAFQNAFAKVMASPALVELQAERVDRYGEISPARYSTQEMINLERGLVQDAGRMAEASSHGVQSRHVEAALERHDWAIRTGVRAHVKRQIEAGTMSRSAGEVEIASARLSDEQRQAVEHVTGGERIAAVVGLAGAGKSTMLAAAREAWEARGYTVRGAALAGKAAEGLEESSGIASRTLASYEHSWQAGRGGLGPRDVLVIDEAGMVGSRQLAHFVGEAERSGAKLVLVGDHEQLQAIGAGAPFRAIAERIGFAELSEVRRQREDWQRGASRDFARHRTGEALSTYAERGAVSLKETREAARAEIVRDYMADLERRPEGTRLAMAHRRVDVRALNEDIRAARQARGELAKGGRETGEQDKAGLGREQIYETRDGERSFAAGDRFVFLENNRDLGVKNGMLGEVEAVEPHSIRIRLDGGAHGSKGARQVTIDPKTYQSFDHGYATTIHKTQGATVDRGFVLASSTMDRHLTYVAMTRHRDEARLYAGQDEFKGGMPALAARLSRDGSKETTLDYTAGYAERRGIAEQLGLRSEIERPEQGRMQEKLALEIPAQARPGGERLREDATPSQRGDSRPARQEHEAQPPALPRETEEPGPQRPARRQGMFSGLKLNAGADRPTPSQDRARQGAENAQARPERGPAFAENDEHGRLLRATEDLARAFVDVARMKDQGLPVVEHQEIALRKAGAALEAVRPGGTQELTSALQHDAQTRSALAQMRGDERAEQLLAGMERERQAQLDPNVRAERLVARWNKLEQEHGKLKGWQQREERQEVESGMRAIAGEIKRDAPVEAVLRDKQQDLGITHNSTLGRALRQEQPGQALERALERGERQRGQDLSR